MNRKTVFVTGANGFIGRYVVKRFLDDGFKVVGLTRNNNPYDFNNINFKWTVGDILDYKALEGYLKGSDVVVHLAAITSEKKSSYEESFKVNVIGTKNLIEACRMDNIGRVISLSSESTKRKKKGNYARTKQEADEMLINSGLTWTILKPTIVYGPGEKGVFGKLKKHINNLPVIPIIGNGEYRFYPIYVGDVASAVAEVIKNETTVNKIYDLSGEERVSFNFIIDQMLEIMDKKKPKIHLPLFFCKIIAVLLSVLPNPPLTLDNIYGSVQEIVPNLGPAKRDFSFKAISFREGLEKSV